RCLDYTDYHTLSLHDALPILDMFDTVNALDDHLERFRDELDGILCLEAIGAHEDVDHRHRDLRFFLARQGNERQQAERQRGNERSEEHTSELQSRENLVCRLL